MHRADSTQTAFNYSVINWISKALKPATIVLREDWKNQNAAGETIGPKEISFTTEESPSMTFDTKINPKFSEIAWLHRTKMKRINGNEITSWCFS
ncbi:MAG: hypothetical protein R2877_07145 [Bdellovibrionota bacterium]